MVCFYGFQCNSSAVYESLKGFFCDLQTAWRLVLSMKPWSYIWLEFGLFSTIIAIFRACACWALFVVTLTNTVHFIYIYIYCNPATLLCCYWQVLLIVFVGRSVIKALQFGGYCIFISTNDIASHWYTAVDHHISEYNDEFVHHPVKHLI